MCLDATASRTALQMTLTITLVSWCYALLQAAIFARKGKHNPAVVLSQPGRMSPRRDPYRVRRPAQRGQLTVSCTSGSASGPTAGQVPRAGKGELALKIGWWGPPI